MNNNFRKKDSARLTWDTKPRRAPNPKDIEFQTAEVVIPNPQTAGDLPLSFRDGLFGDEEIDKKKMNRLIWGDNLLAMQALLAQGYEGKINLIYIDPPFDSKADYSHKIIIEGNNFIKEPSIIERLAYKDTWTGGTDSYLDMLYPRLQLMKRLLSENGSIYVHCDWHVNSYIRIMLDEIFGKKNLINEIVWCYTGPRKTPKAFSRKHDIIFLYSKSTQNYTFNPQKISHKSGIHDTGEVEAFGRCKEVRLSEEHFQGIKELEKKGKQLEDWWIDIWATERYRKELLGFETQKPKALLKRIIKTSSNDSDLVADFFCGSGTTLEVAEKLNRRWIGCELGKVGIQVTRSCLFEQMANPFLIENIGNYQREMIYLTGGRIWEMQHLILKLYGATPRDKMSGLGVRKSDDGIDELVYVGYPDRPITAKKAEELACQAQKLDGRGYKRLVILGWDYEYNYHQSLEDRLKALNHELKIKIESRDIPPDIYDYLQTAKSEDDIEAISDKVKFYERPYLKLNNPELSENGNRQVKVKISIKRYVLMDIPISHITKTGQDNYSALMKLAKDNFAVLIDYWAVDWDYDGFTFKSQWQAFRGNGKKAKSVTTVATEVLEEKNNRTIAVRVVDVFGNDATATLEV